MRQHITDEADARLAFYLSLPEDLPPGIEAPPRPKLPDDVVDAPLVRVFNFLREFHLSFSPSIFCCRVRSWNEEAD